MAKMAVSFAVCCAVATRQVEKGFGMSDWEPTDRRLSRAPALTGIRAVAIGLVILVHTNISVAQGGWIGVDVFFVLTGFLITALLLNEHDANGRFSIPKFYVRRVFRLVPAYWAFLLIVVVWASIWRSGEFGSWSSEVVKSATYQMDFFDINHFPQIGIGQVWSLAIEEQFYLIWPLLLLVDTRQSGGTDQPRLPFAGFFELACGRRTAFRSKK